MNSDVMGLYFAILTLALRFHYPAGDRHRTARAGFDDLRVIGQSIVGNCLNSAEAGTVVNVQKGETTL